jgi:hypothetical protein
MTGGFHVDPDALRTHASSIDAVGEAVDTAHSAAGEENIGGLVYGVIFDPLVLVGMGAWTVHLQDLMRQSAEVARVIAGGVRSNADTYDGIEQSTVTTVTRSGSGPR